MTAAKKPKNDVRVVPVRKDQAPQAAKILSTAFNMAAQPTKKDIVDSLAAGSQVTTFVASKDKEVIGVIRCMVYPKKPNKPPTFYIYQLAVDPACRQQGIGHALMRRIENHIARKTAAGENALVFLSDEIKESNPASMFYEKMGYGTGGKPRRDKEGLLLLMKYVAGKRAPGRKAAPAAGN